VSKRLTTNIHNSLSLSL